LKHCDIRNLLLCWWQYTPHDNDSHLTAIFQVNLGMQTPECLHSGLRWPASDHGPARLSFYRHALPVAQSTVSKHLRKSITFHGLALPKLTCGLPTSSLATKGSRYTLGAGCQAPHQPSDASTQLRYTR